MKSIFSDGYGRVFRIFIIAAVVFASAQSAAAKEGKAQYVIGMHFASVGGQSSSSLFDLVKMIVESSAEETGYEIKLQKFPSHQAVVDAWLKNELDGGLLHVGEAVRLINSGGEVIPWATFIVDKKDRSQTCFWHRKEMPVKSPEDLMGKSLIHSAGGGFGLISIREKLLELGVDKPLWEVFDSFVFTPSGNSTFMALAMKEGDILWNDSDQKFFLKLISSNLVGELKYDLCTDYSYSRGFIGINPKTVKKEDVAAAIKYIDKYISNIESMVKEHPELQAMYKYSRMVKMKVVKAGPDEIAYELKLYEKARSRGWVKEVAFIEKQLANAKPGDKVTIKPDMEYCKGVCAKGDSDCVLSCLE